MPFHKQSCSARWPDDTGVPLSQRTDPSSLKIKKIGDAWYGSAHIYERIGVSPSVQLNTTVNFMVKASDTCVVELLQERIYDSERGKFDGLKK
jgi:hypothetical protein